MSLYRVDTTNFRNNTFEVNLVSIFEWYQLKSLSHGNSLLQARINLMIDKYVKKRTTIKTGLLKKPYRRFIERNSL